MGYLDFYNKLKSMEGKDYIESFLLYNISQVISGIKPASTVTFKKSGDKLYEKWSLLWEKIYKRYSIRFC